MNKENNNMLTSPDKNTGNPNKTVDKNDPNIIDVDYYVEESNDKDLDNNSTNLSSENKSPKHKLQRNILLVIILILVGSFIIYKVMISSNSADTSDNNISVNTTDEPEFVKTPPSETAKKYINKYKDHDYIISTSNSSNINISSLNDYSVEELFLARNEIFARNGYVFKSSPNLQAYFESKTWYKPDVSYNGLPKSDLENQNSQCIKSIEFLKVSHKNASSIDSDYIFPNSSTVLLTAEEISSLNDWQLIIAKNEIFARYGLKFSSRELNEHFNSKYWYSINDNVNTNNLQLNEIETQNSNLLINEENKRMTKVLSHDLGE